MNSFWQGFEKQSGVIDKSINKIKGLFTGKHYLYHGTSPTKASEILKSGLKPDMGGGISNLVNLAHTNKGLVFTTKNKDTAKFYARQQEAIENVSKNFAKLEWLRRKLPEGKIKKALKDYTTPGSRKFLKPAMTRATMPFYKGKVLKLEVPKKDIEGKVIRNPEIKELVRRGVTVKNTVKDMPSIIRNFISKGIKTNIRNAHGDDVVIKGSIGAGNIKSAFLYNKHDKLK